MQKVVIVVLLVIFVMQKLVIVRDWIILADDDSIASNAEFYFLCYVHVLLQSDAITLRLSLMCLAGSRDILCLLTELLPCLQTDFKMEDTLFYR